MKLQLKKNHHMVCWEVVLVDSAVLKTSCVRLRSSGKWATCIAAMATTSLTQLLMYLQDVKLINRHQQFSQPLISLLPTAINCETELLRLARLRHNFAV